MYLNTKIKLNQQKKKKSSSVNLLKKKFAINNLFNFVYLINLSLNKFIKEIFIYKNEIIVLIDNLKYCEFLFLFFKKHFKFQLNSLVDICAVDDYSTISTKKRFVLNYSLLSVKYKIRARLKFYCDALDGIPSISNIFLSANWLEREVWDMFGIFFKKHPDLRRILTDYGFEGFPFRKDFPLSGYVELRYDSEKRVVIYELLEMTQEFRFFEFINPWDWTLIKK